MCAATGAAVAVGRADPLERAEARGVHLRASRSRPKTPSTASSDESVPRPVLRSICRTVASEIPARSAISCWARLSSLRVARTCSPIRRIAGCGAVVAPSWHAGGGFRRVFRKGDLVGGYGVLCALIPKESSDSPRRGCSEGSGREVGAPGRRVPATRPRRTVVRHQARRHEPLGQMEASRGPFSILAVGHQWSGRHPPRSLCGRFYVQCQVDFLSPERSDGEVLSWTLVLGPSQRAQQGEGAHCFA